MQEFHNRRCHITKIIECILHKMATILKLGWGFENMSDLPFLFDSLSIHVVICSVHIEKRERE